jgi:large conductance mechanosensitive channel
VLFLVVKAMNQLMRKQEEAPKPAETPADVQLLTEIRDLLATSRERTRV